MKRFSLLLLIVSLAGCETPQTRTVDSLAFSGTPAIALMPLDVELSLLTANGTLEPRSEWTDSAKGHMNVAIERFLDGHNINLVNGAGIAEDELVDLLSLHEVVGETILVHHYMIKLPSKGDKLDWTLGKEATALREELGADYGLFVFVRDSYASAGRIALQIFAAAARVGVSGGMQVGFASLVDLRTGRVVWFNRLISSSGDLRETDPAEKSVERLLNGFPL